MFQPQYFVKVGSNPTITLDINPDETVLTLKCRAIAKLLRVNKTVTPPHNLTEIAKHYRVMYSTKPLLDTHYLTDYQIPKESTISMLVLASAVGLVK
jgi:hypothetical protein